MNTIITVTLPWPDSALSPNSRSQWKKIKAVTEARKIAQVIMLSSKRLGPTTGAELTIYYRFYPPSKRRYDLDGLVSRCKAYQDQIFHYLELDDNLITTLDARRCEIRPDGSVEIMIAEGEG